MEQIVGRTLRICMAKRGTRRCPPLYPLWLCHSSLCRQIASPSGFCLHDADSVVSQQKAVNNVLLWTLAVSSSDERWMLSIVKSKDRIEEARNRTRSISSFDRHNRYLRRWVAKCFPFVSAVGTPRGSSWPCRYPSRLRTQHSHLCLSTRVPGLAMAFRNTMTCKCPAEVSALPVARPSCFRHDTPAVLPTRDPYQHLLRAPRRWARKPRTALRNELAGRELSKSYSV